jgi:hypothetical protein
VRSSRRSYQQRCLHLQGAARSLRIKGDWIGAAKEASISKTSAEALLQELMGHFSACTEAVLQLRAAAAGSLLAGAGAAATPDALSACQALCCTAGFLMT